MAVTPVPKELYANNATTTVTSGGTTAPAAGTSETWTVSSSSPFPPASSTATPPSVFHVADTAVGSTTETIQVTNVSGSTWTVTRGADATTPVAHSPGFTIQNVLSSSSLAQVTGMANVMQYLTNGGTITTTTISNAVAQGYCGIFLDPNYVWNMVGVSFFGVSNFTLESRMQGSIGWLGNIAYGPGYISTGTSSTADGILVFGYTGNETQGLVFRGLSFVGANSNAVVHFGGRQRHCLMERCFIYNTNSSTGAYGLIDDTGLTGSGSYPTSMNSEDQCFSHMDIAGAYAAIGIGIGDTGQHANDTLWIDVTTATAGPYSVVVAPGGNHHFHNYYDRSSPSIATVYNSGGQITFWGGEDQNNSASGVAHLLDNSSSATTLMNRTVTVSGNTTTLQVSAGNLVGRGRTRWGGTVALSGTGNVDLSDPAGSYSGLSISGSSGSLMLAGNYNPGTGPSISGWSGSVLLQAPAVVASKSATGQTTTQTTSWTPPASNCAFRVSVMIHPTVAGTSTVPVLSFTEFGGTAFSQTLPMWKQDSTATTPSYTCNATGTFVGTFTSKTNNAGATVSVAITPTGSTYRYSVVIEQLTYS